MSNFEEKLSELKDNRAKLNQANSFDEITSLWKQVKTAYENCSSELEKINEELSKNSESTDSLEQISFSDALNEMQKISEKIKTESISNISEMIKKMQILKDFCLKELEKEKIQMEKIE